MSHRLPLGAQRITHAECPLQLGLSRQERGQAVVATCDEEADKTGVMWAAERGWVAAPRNRGRDDLAPPTRLIF